MENIDNNVVGNEEVNKDVNVDIEVQAEKTFTQSELDDIITKRLAKEAKKIEKANEEKYQAQLKAELEESEKLARMTEADRLKAKAEKERKQYEADRVKFEEEMKAFNQEKMLNTTMKSLSEKGLPVEFASFIKADTADDIMENINSFEKGFKDAVDKAVAERLRGRTPQAGATTTKFNMDDLKSMSADEINKNWNTIKQKMR